MPSEFDLIRRYFTHTPRHTVLGVGDDGALIRPDPAMELVISTDMLVEGTHFFPDANPRMLGWKTLAVNISDMAAMGATPRWALLSLALPQADENWIDGFAAGFMACAQAHDVDLIGGDTTRGPLNLSVTILGEVPRGQALLRRGAQPGDDIWISGTPGCAALGLKHLQGHVVLPDPAACLQALHQPQPRVALGLALRGLATAALDVSDGLLGDLTHILECSHVEALIEVGLLPLQTLNAQAPDAQDLTRDCLLTGGDDYELLFCAPPNQRDRIHTLSNTLNLPLTRIGTIQPPSRSAPTPTPTITLIDTNGQAIPKAAVTMDKAPP